MSWRLNRTATYWPPNSSGYNSISFPFSCASQPGGMGAEPVLGHGSHSESSLQLIWTFCRWGYIIIWHPPTSCERHICTQFNPSTVKVIPWYLRPDSPVIYTGAFFIWQPGRVGGQYVTPCECGNVNTKCVKMRSDFLWEKNWPKGVKHNFLGQYTDCISAEGSPAQRVSCIWIKIKWWCAFCNAGSLGNVECLFTAITSTSTLTPSGSTW